MPGAGLEWPHEAWGGIGMAAQGLGRDWNGRTRHWIGRAGPYGPSAQGHTFSKPGSLSAGSRRALGPPWALQALGTPWALGWPTKRRLWECSNASSKVGRGRVGEGKAWGPRSPRTWSRCHL